MFLSSLCLFLFLGTACSEWCFDVINGDNCIRRVQIGLEANQTNLACSPLLHSFTWSSSFDPISKKAYFMGGKGTSFRTLYTVNLTNGDVISAPKVGYVYDTAYNLAADLRGNGRLYGTWNEESWTVQRPAEIDPISGKPKQFFTPANFQPPNDTNCGTVVRFSNNFGFFEKTGNNYVTLWSCQKYRYLLRINVDYPRASFQKIGKNYPVDDFVVHPDTGIAYILSYLGSGHKAVEVNQIVNDEENSFKLVMQSYHPDSPWILSMYQLVPIPDGICVHEPQDTRRAHPQAPDLLCGMLDTTGNVARTAFFSAPNVGKQGDTLPYMSHAIPTACDK